MYSSEMIVYICYQYIKLINPSSCLLVSDEIPILDDLLRS